MKDPEVIMRRFAAGHTFADTEPCWLPLLTAAATCRCYLTLRLPLILLAVADRRSYT